MDILKNFLKRFEKIKNPKEDKQLIASLLSTQLHIIISAEQIELKDGVVTVKGIPAIVRSQIFTHKSEFLDSLKKNHPQIFITDLR